ncbi:uncharacterized protein LOC111694876 isoform X3 [Eurytemora carolleeae]|uniref:uncharacterized protein LOC111694876 isoform X3 n=1 Tax=Eurytemora carolleeae TaxID=1294199 RepID=UPI000C78DE42|nr:uncharacterized protein LOC111694876 isoform X3 [Eurytemora carolleeae]|eukprot:XP_023319695.1 uncharacterized protein LOC111694876 isoform X3 [Eurytemora affinis]
MEFPYVSTTILIKSHSLGLQVLFYLLLLLVTMFCLYNILKQQNNKISELEEKLRENELKYKEVIKSAAELEITTENLKKETEEINNLKDVLEMETALMRITNENLETENAVITSLNLTVEQDITKMLDTFEQMEQERQQMKGVLEKAEKEKNAILKHLEKQVNCSVCLCSPRTARIPVCRNGHTTCDTCTRDTCPMCRVRMEPGMFSPLALSITDLLEYPCTNLEKGCQMYASPCTLHAQPSKDTILETSRT